ILEAWKARGYRYTAGSPSAIMVTPGMRRNFFRTSATFKGGTAAGTAVTAGFAAPGGVALLTGFLDAALTFGVLGGATAVGTGVFAAVTAPKYLRDPKRLNRRNRQKAAGAEWLTPASLGYLPGRKE
ncbi:hypothetical protein KCW65_21655, partial [Mycobacterium tuberculosis]|nr:hypothetical protein [Mycobacterium tuberculosis]